MLFIVYEAQISFDIMFEKLCEVHVLVTKVPTRYERKNWYYTLKNCEV